MKPNRYIDGALLCAGVSKRHGLCGQYAKRGSRYCHWHDKKTTSWDEIGPELLDVLECSLDTIINCCVPAGGCDDKVTILQTRFMMQRAIDKAREIGK